MCFSKEIGNFPGFWETGTKKQDIFYVGTSSPLWLYHGSGQLCSINPEIGFPRKMPGNWESFNQEKWLKRRVHISRYLTTSTSPAYKTAYGYAESIYFDYKGNTVSKESFQAYSHC